MVTLHAVPLSPGQVRTQEAAVLDLYNGAKPYVSSEYAWEGLFRLACICTDAPLEERVTQVIQDMIAAQQPDGSYKGLPDRDVAIARAALALYEYGNSREILQSLLLFCSWISGNWTNVMNCREIRRRPGDLMEFLVALYRYTGKTAILSLCDKLRMDSIHWSAILHTYPVRRPTYMMASWLETRAGIDRERDADDGQYTRQFMISHAETLADGLRSAWMTAQYSGSATESDAGKVGWSKIAAAHAAVCGGTTADECVQGTDPSIAIDTAAVGAWTEAFLVQLTHADCAWAEQQLDLLIHNALPACFQGGKLNGYQRVNFLDRNTQLRDCYHTHSGEEQKRRGTNRLVRAWQRAYMSAIMTTKAGCEVHLYLNGEYDFQMHDSTYRVSMRHLSESSVQLSLQTRQPVQAEVRLRVPAYMTGLQLAINGKAAAFKLDKGWITLDRIWNHGDTVSLVWVPEVHVVETYHQGRAVMYGPQLMTVDVTDRDWHVALVGEPYLEEGLVHCTLAPVADMKDEDEEDEEIEEEIDKDKDKDTVFVIPFPVVPAVTSERENVTMVPYTASPLHLTVIPKAQA